MANIKTPNGTIRVNRDGYSPDYYLKVSFSHDDSEEGYITSSKVYLSGLVEGSVRSRSDVTGEVIQEALDAWFEGPGSNHTGLELHDVQVLEEAIIRMRPYEDKYPDK
ncbi:MAG: hypothetical protein R3324_01565 [Halobacteriales archaeon]|nr:hypothetical protein [Halobacteriales archaeon]